MIQFANYDNDKDPSYIKNMFCKETNLFIIVAPIQAIPAGSPGFSGIYSLVG